MKRYTFPFISLFFGLVLATLPSASAWGPQDIPEPHGQGITRAEYLTGLAYASFNNYTDNSIGGLGMADEREFLVIRNETTGGDYSKEVNATVGDVLLVSAFFHNNGAANDARTSALDVVTQMAGIQQVEDGFASAAGSKIDLQQKIISSNANPGEIWDDISVVSADGTPIKLRYRNNLVITPNRGGGFTPLDVNGFFSSGTPIGDPSNPTGGIFRGGMENAMHTFAYFDVLNGSGENSSQSSAENTISNDKNQINQTSNNTLNVIVSPSNGGIAVNAGGGGQIACGENYTNCTGNYNAGEVVALSIAHETLPFIGWTGCDSTVGKYGCHVTMNANKTVEAHFGSVIIPSPPVPSSSEPRAPSCPLTPSNTLTVVDFGNSGKAQGETNYLLSNNSAHREIVKSATLPAGTYTVQTVSWDGYASRATVSQKYEQWNVEARNGSSLLGKVGPTSDIADQTIQNTKQNTFTDALILGSSANTVAAVHAFPSDTSSPNSVVPICIGFTKKAVAPAPSCTLSANPTSIAQGTSTTLTLVSQNADSATINQGVGSIANNGTKNVTPNQTTTYTATVTGAGGTATCQTTVTVTIATPTPTSDPSVPACPFSSSDGTVVIFTTNRTPITSSQYNGADARRYLETNASFPAGTYTVKTFSWDGYNGRENVSQTHEQWNVEAYSGSLMVSVGSTTDIADYVRSASRLDTFTDALVLPQAVTKVRAQHAFVNDTSSPNSVVPVCAAFKQKIVPTPTPTPNPANITVNKKVSKDGTSYSQNIIIGNGETAFYKVFVENTGTGIGNVSVTDQLGAASNGGSLSLINSESVSCPTGATCTGSLAGTGINITNLGPTESVSITYKRTANNAGVALGQDSNIPDTITLSNGKTDTATVTVAGNQPAKPNLTVEKRVSNGGVFLENVTVEDGRTAYYRIAVKNTGTAAGSVLLTDILSGPDNGGSLGAMLLETIDCSSNTCTGSLAAGGLQINNLAPGDCVVIDYQRIADNAGIPTQGTSEIINTATLSSGGFQSAKVIITGPQSYADFTIEKRVSKDDTGFVENVTVDNGDTAYYRIAVKNTGTGPGTFTIKDTLSNSTNGGSLGTLTNEAYDCNPGATCSGSLAGGDLMVTNLPVGELFIIDYQRVANNNGIPTGQSSTIIDTADLYVNTRKIASDTASVSIEGTGVSDFTVQKDVSADNQQFGDIVSLSDGSIAYYRIRVQNTGIGAGTVVLTDSLAAPTNGGALGAIFSENTDCSSGAACSGTLAAGGITIQNIKPGATATITYRRSVSNAGIPGGAFSNIIDTAVLKKTGVTVDTDTANVTIYGPPSAPTCANLIASPASVNPNTPFVLSWNSGNQQSFKLVSNPGNLSITQNGADSLFEVAAGISGPTEYTLTIYNGENQTGESAVCKVLKVPVNQPDFTITKQVSTDGLTFTDDPITIDDNEVAYFAIVVKNTGGRTGVVEITDIPVEGSNGGSLTLNGPAFVSPPGICVSGNAFNETDPLQCVLAPNATATISYSKTGDNNEIPVGTISDFVNTASIVSTTQKDTAQVRIKGAKPAPDLATAIFADDYDVAPSTTENPTRIHFRVDWQNLGNVDMENTTIAVSCDADALTNLQSADGAVSGNTVLFGPYDTIAGNPGNPVDSFGSYTFSGDVASGFGTPTADTFKCYAHIESADYLPISAKETDDKNNDDELEIIVSTVNASKRYKKVKNLSTLELGTQVAAVEGDKLLYTLGYKAGDRPETNFVFSDNIGDILEYATITDLGGGKLSGSTIAWPAQNLTAFQNVEVTFTVQVFDEIDTVGGDFKMTNVFGDKVKVILPELAKKKFVRVNNGPLVAEASARPGDIITYTLQVTNNGDDSRNGYVFSEDIGDSLQYAEVRDLGGGVLNGNIISWPAITIPCKGIVEKTFQLQIKSPLPTSGDLILNNIFGTKTEVKVSEISLAKKATNTRTGDTGTAITAQAGDDITYTLTVKETGGGSPYEDYVISDNVTDILQYATISNLSDGGTFDTQNNAVTWPAIDVPAGQTVTRTFHATVTSENSWSADGDFEMENVFGNLVTVTVGKVIVDNVLQKSATPAEVAPGMEITFTLTYFNQGKSPATGSIITDDFDETKIEIKKDANGDPIIPQFCRLLSGTGVNQALVCEVGTLLPGAPAQSFTYTGVVLAPATGNVVNNAEITQIQEDIDLSNNKASTTTPINTGGLVITKTANPTSLNSGQKTTYTVTVTNNSPVKKTFSVTDALQAGNNGGLLTYDINTFSVLFAPLDSGTTAGNIGSGPVTITDLAPGAKAILTYQRMADTKDIPFNQVSHFLNKATIVETGMSADADVVVVGPKKGGGGGGGGGGGRRVVSDSINLHINKEVKDKNGVWQDADTYNLAALIGNAKKQNVEYRIIVRNEGNKDGENVKVQDTFTSMTLSRVNVKNVAGAAWDGTKQVFTIASLKRAEAKTITYTAELVVQRSSTEAKSAENIAEIIAADATRSTISVGARRSSPTIRGIGQKDSAFVQFTGDKLTLKKVVDKKVVKPGDEAVFSIIVQNKSGFDYENLVITDNFPFPYLELITANDLKNVDKDAETMTFSKRELKEGGIWIIKLKTRVKNSVPGNTRVRNTVTISADNADLSDLFAFAEIIVTPLPKPEALIPSGPATTVLLMLATLTGAYAIGRRRFRKKTE